VFSYSECLQKLKETGLDHEKLITIDQFILLLKPKNVVVPETVMLNLKKTFEPRLKKFKVRQELERKKTRMMRTNSVGSGAEISDAS